jgi:hypothetical protein
VNLSEDQGKILSRPRIEILRQRTDRLFRIVPIEMDI